MYYLHDDKVIWKCEFDNYLFGLSKLDVNDDGTDEVVVVSSTTGQVCMYVCANVCTCEFKCMLRYSVRI